jgi:hypothetical protein
VVTQMTKKDNSSFYRLMPVLTSTKGAGIQPKGLPS